MIDRRAFISGLAWASLGTTLWSQTRLQTAQDFVKATKKYAEDLGQALADQDMLNIAVKVLMRADEVGNAFRQYEGVHGGIIIDLENRVKELLEAPRSLKANRDQLSDRYDKLKAIIRDRYEASWIITDLDKAQQDLVEAFSNGAKELTELSKTGRTPSKQELDQKNTQLLPPYQVSQQNSDKLDCKFFARSPKLPTDAGSGGPSSSTSAKPPDSGSDGQYILSCPGPEGDNDWIKWSNYFGQAGLVLANGIYSTGPLGVVFLIATVALVALSLIVGGIGIVVRGDAIEAETREINEAEMYKFLHSALPSDVVVSYKRRAASNVILLRQAAEEVRTFVSGAPASRNQLLRAHESERKSQEGFGQRLANLQVAKCRINARNNTKLGTAVQQCPLETGPGSAAQAADDDRLLEKEQKALTIDRLWEFVRFQMIELLIARSQGRTQEQERRAWLQVDQALEKEFLKLMVEIDLVSDIAEIHNKSVSDTLAMELHYNHQYSVLRGDFMLLVADAVKVAYSDLAIDEYKQRLARFQDSLDRFMMTEGAHSSLGVNLQHAFVVLKQRSL